MKKDFNKIMKMRSNLAKKPTRRLISLYKVDWGDNAGKWYISFSYYDEKDECIPDLREEAYLTEEQLHDLLKENLIKGG